MQLMSYEVVRLDSTILGSPEVVPFAQYEIGLCVEGRSDLSEPTVAAAALETVLVPEQVQGTQHVPGVPHSSGMEPSADTPRTGMYVCTLLSRYTSVPVHFCPGSQLSRFTTVPVLYFPGTLLSRY